MMMMMMMMAMMIRVMIDKYSTKTTGVVVNICMCVAVTTTVLATAPVELQRTILTGFVIFFCIVMQQHMLFSKLLSIRNAYEQYYAITCCIIGHLCKN